MHTCELSLFGDVGDPAGIEFVLKHQLADDKTVRTNCFQFLSRIAETNKLVIAVSESGGTWRLAAHEPKKLDSARTFSMSQLDDEMQRVKALIKEEALRPKYVAPVWNPEPIKWYIPPVGGRVGKPGRF